MRCNLIPVQYLTDQHLIAEKRELRMIPALLNRRISLGKHLTNDIPKNFTLNTGHMLFWMNKFLYLSNRYDLLLDEMETRGFSADRSLIFDVSVAKQHGLYNDWEPMENDYKIILERLRSKILSKFSWYKYYSATITKQWFEEVYGNF